MRRDSLWGRFSTAKRTEAFWGCVLCKQQNSLRDCAPRRVGVGAADMSKIWQAKYLKSIITLDADKGGEVRIARFALNEGLLLRLNADLY